MVTKKKGLGRGLEALLGSGSKPAPLLDEIPIDRIEPGRFQPRKTFAEDKLDKLKKLSKNAFDLLGCEKWGRVDLIEYEDKFYFIEVNTVPGMTSHSCVPKSGSFLGLEYEEVVQNIINAKL